MKAGMVRKEKIVIANAGGFWGDDPTVAKRQVDGGPIDYLVMDYLAEVTMAILQKQRQRKPEAGFATDFIAQLKDVLPTCIEENVKVVSNAGGVNPMACRAAVEELASQQGIRERVRVAVIVGDDIYGDLDSLLDSGEELANLDTGAPLSEIRDRVLSANVYLGAAPVARALDMGANVVIAGRVTDTALTLGPMMHAFGWKENEWDLLAAGIVAGHILECGAQSTGGNFTDWRKIARFENIGYPLVEASADGTFVVTKHPDTGGMVSVDTVREQLLYEMGTPSYIAPDCVARFDSIVLEQVGVDRVKVSGVRGEAAPERLKVSVSFAHGFRIFGRMLISGPESLEKATTAAEIFWNLAGGRDGYDETDTQLIGWNAAHPPLAVCEPGELLLQVAARDADREKLDSKFGPFIVGSMLKSVPGVAALADQGRPRASDVVGYWPALIERGAVDARVCMGETEVAVGLEVAATTAGEVFTPRRVEAEMPHSGRQVTVPLSRICLARSGDKGDTANVGVIARTPVVYRWLLDHLTTEFVKEHFRELCRGRVERFELFNLLSLNFLLYESLGGGGTLSLRLDAQGKTYGQYMLSALVTLDKQVVDGAGE